MNTSGDMLLLLFLTLASFSACDKLDRTYLPPPGSKLAGGSPGAILAPAEEPKLDESIVATTAKPQAVPGFYNTQLGVGQPNQQDINVQTPFSSDINAPNTNLQGTYNVPTTTTSYAFTQTTTFAPVTCATSDCISDTSSQIPYDGVASVAAHDSFPYHVQTVVPGLSQSVTPGQQQFDYSKPVTNIPGQHIISVPQGTGNLPGTRTQPSRFRPGTEDGLIQQSIPNYQRGDVSQGLRDYSQQPLQQHIPQTQSQFDQTPYGVPPKQQVPGYIHPSNIPSDIPGRTTVLPGSREQYSASPFVDQTSAFGYTPQNLTTIPGFTSTLSPFKDQGTLGLTRGPIRQNQLDRNPIIGRTGDQGSISPNGFNIPSAVLPGTNLISASSTTAAPGSAIIPSYTTPSAFQPNTQGQFIGLQQPSATFSGIKERRPVRPQAEFERNAAILSYENILTPEGFAYSFDTENGIHADESGTAVDGVKAQGAYSYTGDDGKLYSIIYSADENGYQPRGDHLPTPPPIPEAILRVIDQANRNKVSGISDDGSYDDQKYGHKKYQGAMERYNPSLDNEKYRFDKTKPSQTRYDLPDSITRDEINQPSKSDEEVKQNEKNRIPGRIREGGESHNPPGTIRKGFSEPSHTYDTISKYGQQTDDDLTRPGEKYYENRPSSDYHLSDNFDGTRQMDRNSPIVGIPSRSQVNEPQSIISRKGGYPKTEENINYDENSRDFIDERIEDKRRPTRPQIGHVDSNQNIDVGGRVQYRPGYSTTTYRPTQASEQRQYEIDQNKVIRPSNIFQDDNVKHDQINYEPDSDRSEMPASDKNQYLPPSRKYSETSITKFPGRHTQQTRFPSTMSTKRPTTGPIDYRSTTLKPFITPNVSPSTQVSEIDNKQIPTTYASGKPSQVTSYPERRVTTIRPNYDTIGQTRTSQVPSKQYEQSLTSNIPTEPSNYYQQTNAPEQQYQNYRSPVSTIRQQEYSQRDTPESQSSTPILRGQNIQEPSNIETSSQTRDYPGRRTQGQDKYGQDKAQTTALPTDYTRAGSTGPAKGIEIVTSQPTYSPTQSPNGIQKDYDFNRAGSTRTPQQGINVESSQQPYRPTQSTKVIQKGYEYNHPGSTEPTQQGINTVFSQPRHSSTQSPDGIDQIRQGSIGLDQPGVNIVSSQRPYSPAQTPASSQDEYEFNRPGSRRPIEHETDIYSPIQSPDRIQNEYGQIQRGLTASTPQGVSVVPSQRPYSPTQSPNLVQRTFDFAGSTRPAQNIVDKASSPPGYSPTQSPDEIHEGYTYNRPDAGQTFPETNVVSSARPYSPTQSTIGIQGAYPDQTQYTKVTSPTDELPTTYRPAFESYSSTSRPGYSTSFPGSTEDSRIVSSSDMKQPGSVFKPSPSTDRFGRPRDQSVQSTVSPINHDYSRPSERQDISGGRVPTTSTRYYQPSRDGRPESSEGPRERFDFNKPGKGQNRYDETTELRGRPQSIKGVEDASDPDTVTRPGQYDRFSPGQTVKGEDFSGPRQPPRYDPETGYHY